MNRLFILALILLVAVPAFADKPEPTTYIESYRSACDVSSWAWVWDGTFYTEACDTGGAPIWAYGNSTLDPAVDCDGNAVTAVLGTVLNAAYPNDAGERAVLGTLTIDSSNYMLEICHFYDTENSYDGGNVEVGIAGTWTVVSPVGGYPDDLISDSVNYYAWCVDMQPGFTDGPVGYVRDCFVLSEFMGMTVDIAVKFGSDSSVTYPGWYIAHVRAGGLVTPVEESDWSTIKSLY